MDVQGRIGVVEGTGPGSGGRGQDPRRHQGLRRQQRWQG